MGSPDQGTNVALGVQILNHWTIREVPHFPLLSGRLSQHPQYFPYFNSYSLVHYIPMLVSQSLIPENQGQHWCPRACWNYLDKSTLNLLAMPQSFLPIETMVTILFLSAPHFCFMTSPNPSPEWLCRVLCAISRKLWVQHNSFWLWILHGFSLLSASGLTMPHPE